LIVILFLLVDLEVRTVKVEQAVTQPVAGQGAHGETGVVLGVEGALGHAAAKEALCFHRLRVMFLLSLLSLKSESNSFLCVCLLNNCNLIATISSFVIVCVLLSSGLSFCWVCVTIIDQKACALKVVRRLSLRQRTSTLLDC